MVYVTKNTSRSHNCIVQNTVMANNGAQQQWQAFETCVKYALTYDLEYIMRYIVRVILSNNCTRRSLIMYEISYAKVFNTRSEYRY